MPYNSRADVVRLLVERYDNKFNVKLGRFRSQLQTSIHTEELGYNETVCLWMTIYKYIYIYIYIYERERERERGWLVVFQPMQVTQRKFCCMICKQTVCR